MAIPIIDIPTRARALTAIGDATARAVFEVFRAEQSSLFPQDDDPAFLDLADALRKKQWVDEEAAELMRAYGRSVSQGRRVDLRSVARWVLAHESGATAATVVECLQIEPPPEVEIIRVLSRRGSQKVVFLASWRLAQQDIVLKRIIGEADHVGRVLMRELQPHPLSMVHPNIIETHVLRNARGESFLAERRLREVLFDRWRANGLHEAANLLYDMTKALRFLHDHELVHGDIKPDNIGRRENRYVLLDFGICRRVGEYSPTMTPTGSLRTRAPELLLNSHVSDPYGVDIWALGATIFNAMLGRFPLVDETDRVPRISEPEQRESFEAELATRVQNEWGKRLSFERFQQPLRGILELMLARDPLRRPTAAVLAKRVENDLAAFLRSSGSLTEAVPSRFSPHEDFLQIRDYLEDKRKVALMPPPRRQGIIDRLRDLKTLPGFSADELEEIGDLITDLT